MPDVIECPECQRKLSMRDEHLGQDVKCPSCGAVFVASTALRPVVLPPPLAERPPREMERPRLRDRDYDDLDQPRRSRRRYDDDDRGRPGRDVDDYEYSQLKPDRSAVVLTLGIVGLISSCFPPLGWILGGIALGMGNSDLEQMARGRMSRTGQSATQGGKICGLIAIILSTVFVFIYCMRAARDSTF